MRKVIASINMTLDGFCDHTAMIADVEIHQHYTDLLNNSGTILYGRITYHLMENYWPTLVKNPSGNQSLDDFAIALQKIPKIVFSRTIRDLAWENVRLANRDLEKEVLDLKKQNGKDILIGCRSLIISLMQLDLIDEYQLCIHPVVVGSGLPLFNDITDRSVFSLLSTKSFQSGSIVLYYKPLKIGQV